MDILTPWRRLSRVPKGAEIFSFLVGRFAPYTGTLGAVVRELRPGHAEVELKDRRKVRNHLDCVHAIALTNLAEMTSGMAVLSGLPVSMRAILVHLEVDFLKKARGKLRAVCDAEILSSEETRDVEIPITIQNAAGEIVCRASARWRVGPQKKKTQ